MHFVFYSDSFYSGAKRKKQTAVLPVHKKNGHVFGRHAPASSFPNRSSGSRTAPDRMTSRQWTKDPRIVCRADGYYIATDGRRRITPPVLFNLLPSVSMRDFFRS